MCCGVPYSPNVAIHGGGAHDALSDWDDGLHWLGLDGKAITGGSEAVPVEDVESALAGAAYHLPATLHQYHGGQITALVLRQQLESPPLDVEDTHGAITTEIHTHCLKVATSLDYNLKVHQNVQNSHDICQKH